MNTKVDDDVKHLSWLQPLKSTQRPVEETETWSWSCFRSFQETSEDSSTKSPENNEDLGLMLKPASCSLQLVTLYSAAARVKVISLKTCKDSAVQICSLKEAAVWDLSLLLRRDFCFLHLTGCGVYLLSSDWPVCHRLYFSVMLLSF